MSAERKPMFAENETLESKVYQAIGAGSMCWVDTPSGVFDSDRAKHVGDEIWNEVKADRANTQALLSRALEILKLGDSYDRGYGVHALIGEIEKQLKQ